MDIDFAQLYLNLHAQLFDAGRIPIAVAALVLVAVAGFLTGPLRGNANPLIWQLWDALFGRLGDKLGKPGRARADLLFRGFLVSAIAVVLAVLLGRAALLADDFLHLYAVPEIFFVATCLTSGAVWASLLRLYKVLAKPGSEKGAYFAIAQTTRLNLNTTDNFGITRAGMALAARSLDKGVVAPVLWYLIGGVPLLFMYSALAALAWRFGKDGFSKGFGDVPLALEKLAGAVPCALTSFLLTIASLITPKAGVARSLVSWVAFKNAAPYAQGGLPVSIMAYALHISLGGPVQDLGGSSLKNKWVGPAKASAKVDHTHLQRGLYITVIAYILWIAALLGAYVYGA